MQNVQFDTDQQNRPNFVTSPKGGLVGWLIKSGLAKDEAGANKWLVAILIINLILIYIVIKVLS